MLLLRVSRQNDHQATTDDGLAQLRNVTGRAADQMRKILVKFFQDMLIIVDNCWGMVRLMVDVGWFIGLSVRIVFSVGQVQCHV